VVTNAGQDIAISLGLDTVEFWCANELIEDCGAFTAGIGRLNLGPPKGLLDGVAQTFAQNRPLRSPLRVTTGVPQSDRVRSSPVDVSAHGPVIMLTDIPNS
jgi:hypothetical protein